MTIPYNVSDRNITVPALIQNIANWHHDRNLVHGATAKDQFAKLIQEAGELSDNICKGKNIADDVGDMMVVLINLAEREGLSIKDCLEQAWNDIKDRKGRMRDGVFIKEADFSTAPVVSSAEAYKAIFEAEATHQSDEGTLYKKQGKFWSVSQDTGWKVISGCPSVPVKPLLNNLKETI